MRNRVIEIRYADDAERYEDRARAEAERARKKKAQREQQRRKLEERGAQEGRDYVLYSRYAKRPQRILKLEFTEFQELGAAFARIVGTPRAATLSAAQAAGIPPKLKWLKNRVFKTPDHLLLFCLLYYRRFGPNGTKAKPRTEQTALDEFVQQCQDLKVCSSKLRQPHVSRYQIRCLPWVKQAVQDCYPLDDDKKKKLIHKLMGFARPLA